MTRPRDSQRPSLLIFQEVSEKCAGQCALEQRRTLAAIPTVTSRRPVGCLFACGGEPEHEMPHAVRCQVCHTLRSGPCGALSHGLSIAGLKVSRSAQAFPAPALPNFGRHRGFLRNGSALALARFEGVSTMFLTCLRQFRVGAQIRTSLAAVDVLCDPLRASLVNVAYAYLPCNLLHGPSRPLPCSLQDAAAFQGRPPQGDQLREALAGLRLQQRRQHSTKEPAVRSDNILVYEGPLSKAVKNLKVSSCGYVIGAPSVPSALLHKHMIRREVVDRHTKAMCAPCRG